MVGLRDNSLVCATAGSMYGSDIPAQALERARARSPLLRMLRQDFALPILPEQFQKWLAFKRGSRCSAQGTSEVLQVASFLQDDATEAAMLLQLSESLQGVIAYHLAFSSEVHASETPDMPIPGLVNPHALPISTAKHCTSSPITHNKSRSPAPHSLDPDAPEVFAALKALGADSIHPHHLFQAFQIIPLAAIARLPPPLLIYALSAHCTNATLTVSDTSTCEAAHLLFHAPHATPISSLTVAPSWLTNECVHGSPPLTKGKCSGSLCAKSRPCAVLTLALERAVFAHSSTLQHLHLSNVALDFSHLSNLTAALRSCSGLLRTLRLHRVQIIDPGDDNQLDARERLCSLICVSDALEWLCLDACDYHFQLLMASIDISRLRHLRRLSLVCMWPESLRVSRLTQEGLCQMASHVGHLRCLESFELEGACLSQYLGCTVDLLKGLQACRQLQSVSLAHTSPLVLLRAIDFGDLARQLTHLNLRDKPFLRHISREEDAFTGAGRWLSAMPALRVLRLGGSLTGTGGLSWLLPAFGAMRALTRLELAGSDVCEEAVGKLVAVLWRLPELAELDLSGNKLRFAPPVDVAEARPVRASLPRVQLEWLKIFAKPEAPNVRLSAPLGFCALRNLDLSANQIRCSRAFVELFITSAPLLTSLHLAGNSLGNMVEAIHLSHTSTMSPGPPGPPRPAVVAQALSHLHHLQHIDLRWNTLDISEALEILEGLGGLSALRKVDLRENGLVMLPDEFCLGEQLTKYPSVRIPPPADANGIGHGGEHGVQSLGVGSTAIVLTGQTEFDACIGL